MFGFFEEKKGEVVDHWYALVPGFNTSAKEFYDAVEQELKDREVPGLEKFRVDFAEGGALSRQREYLRMTRERLVFDVCAAPFGNGYFFSLRFVELPAAIKLWQLAAVLLGSVMMVLVAFEFLGLILGPLAMLAGFALLVYILRNAVAMGLKDLDATLVKSPVFGSIYENWFRRETYYRHDTRLMYCDTVNAVVKAKVEETTGAKGIRLIRYMENCPILGKLYQPCLVPLPNKE